MARIVTCTYCWQEVAIPEGVDQRELVRCPICDAEYLLSEVLSDAAEAEDDAQLPPELVSVAAGPQEGLPVEASYIEVEPAAEEEQEQEEEQQPGGVCETHHGTAGVGNSIGAFHAPYDSEVEEPVDQPEQPAAEAEEPVAEAEQPAEEAAEPARETVEPGEETEKPASDAGGPAPATPEAAGREEIVRVRCPVCEAEYGLHQVVAVSTGEQLGPAVAAAVTRAVAGAAAAEGPALDVWARADAMPQIDLGGGAAGQPLTAEAGAFDFAKQDSEAADVPAGRVGARPRRRRQKSMARVIGGWLFGMVAGPVIAYYVLCSIKGDAGNLFKIPVPGIPHTYKYSPDWFPSWLKPAPDPEEAPPDELAEVDPPDNPARPREPDEKPSLARPQWKLAGVPARSDGRGFGAAALAPPKPKTFPEGYVGLVQPPSYSSDDLGGALKTAHESLADPSKPISEETYRKLCRLAEVMTFVDSGPGAKQLGSRRSAVRTLLEKMGEDPANLDKIGYQAGALCVAQNRPGNGILLAGTVTKMAAEGNAHGAHVQLAASGRTILVAGKQPLPAQVDDSVLILGTLVDNPAENLVGFKTQQPFVVWAGLTVKIEP